MDQMIFVYTYNITIAGRIVGVSLKPHNTINLSKLFKITKGNEYSFLTYYIQNKWGKRALENKKYY